MNQLAHSRSDPDRLKLLSDIQESLFLGQVAQHPVSQNTVYIDGLASFFKQQPHLLPKLLSRLVECDSRTLKVITASVFCVDDVETALLRQNLHFKVGGRISQKKWRNHFAPSLQETVMCFS